MSTIESTQGPDCHKRPTSSASQGQPWKASERKAHKEGQHKTVYLPSGNQYAGSWHNDKRHGKGVLTYKNGDKYEGDFANGVRHGNGAMWRYRAGKYMLEYEGGWEYDRPHGHGYWSDGTGTSYDGEWQAGRRHGQGRAVYNGRVIDGFGGDVYEGSWVDDMREGRGTLVKANGDIYEGYWHQDMKHGTGSYFFMERGKRYDGVWHQDSPKCGSYSELQPAAPGVAGSLPTLEAVNPDGVLEAAAMAVLEMQQQ